MIPELESIFRIYALNQKKTILDYVFFIMRIISKIIKIKKPMRRS
jgi:hypothetical protein